MLTNPSLINFVPASQFQVYLLWVNTYSAQCLNSVLNKCSRGLLRDYKPSDGSFSSSNFPSASPLLHCALATLSRLVAGGRDWQLTENSGIFWWMMKNIYEVCGGCWAPLLSGEMFAISDLHAAHPRTRPGPALWLRTGSGDTETGR